MCNGNTVVPALSSATEDEGLRAFSGPREPNGLKGLVVCLPLAFNAKRPPKIRGWQRMLPETLRLAADPIFKRNSCGVGWRLDGLLVADADSTEGVSWIEGAIASGALPETVSVDTRRGRQYLYRLTARIGSSKIRLPGHIEIDILTGKGHYVVAVGSPAEGYTRDWTPKRSPDEVGIASLSDQEADVILAWVSDARQLKRGAPPRHGIGKDVSKARRAPTTEIARAAASPLERDYEQGVEEGRRDSTCVALVLYYWRRGRGRREIEDMLLGWNLRNRPPWSRSKDGSSPEEWINERVNRICSFTPVMSKPSGNTKQARCEEDVIRWASERVELIRGMWTLEPDAIDECLKWSDREGLEVWSRKRVGMGIRAVLPVGLRGYSYPKKGIKHQYRLYGMRLRSRVMP
ncbi:MAG: bifunctional DNA primase/polymerase [Candidatus Coatesbacteria bacterium]|nr:bifunctional DNA primase/polymerase [Candidatus Coatesbacteria bacterium]